MNKEMPPVLIIDDEEGMLITYKNILEDDFSLTLCQDPRDGIKLAKEKEFRAVILDLKMPEMDGIEALKIIKKNNPKVEVIVATAVNNAKNAVLAIKLGAFDYITKPIAFDELKILLKKVEEKQQLQKENLYLKSIIKEQSKFSELIGKSKEMQGVFATIKNISTICSTVLITGESGTGKELVAHAIHATSERKNRPFLVVNCAAIPENLFESELFGHERGSFTGAVSTKIGKFEFADQGTIFLDEIGLMPKNMQAKLLRVLSEGKIERIGSKNPITVNLRILAATNVNLENEIKNGNFREDLYYRLNVIPIKLAPLRERVVDIPLLVDYFLRKLKIELKKDVSGIDDSVVEKLKKYSWPGNVRELRNIIERAVALCNNKLVITEINLNNEQDPPFDDSNTLKNAVINLEKNHISKILQKMKGNQSEAARVLGINRTTLIYKMRQYGLK